MAKNQYCQCYKCKRLFKLQEAAIEKEKLYQFEIDIKVCPYCGCKSWDSMNHRGYLDRYLKFRNL